MKTLCFALALLMAGFVQHCSSQPLPYAALSAPVLITLSNGETGSGFYFDCSNHLFLATARHVLFDPEGRLKSTEATFLSGAYSAGEGDVALKVGLGILHTNKEIRFHSSHDTVLVRLAQKAPGKGWAYDSSIVKFVNYPKSGIATIGLGLTRRVADLKAGEDVFVFGYPTSIGLQQSPKFDYSKPLLRKGIVSAIYQQTQTIVLDSSVYFGNSGGPVMAVSDGHQFAVIGVVSEMIPFMDVWENKRFNYVTGNLSNSGYSVVEPIDFLLDLIWD